MRKLGKTFTKRYAFKRKLTTAPEINRLYKKREEAIGKIVAVKDAALYETDEPLSVQTGADINPSDASKIQLIHRGATDWPRRVIYPEQIGDLGKARRDVWAVNLTLKEWGRKHTFKVSIRHIDYPIIVTTWRGLSIHPEYRPVDKDELSKIDEETKVHFYVQGNTDHKKGLDPWSVFACGVCPSSHTLNVTFYDREVAVLYAESLTHEMSKTRAAYTMRPGISRK